MKPNSANGPVLEDFLLERIPSVRWQIYLDQEDEIVVKEIGRHQKRYEQACQRRKAVLEEAARFQAAYFRSEDIRHLKLLTSSQLSKRLGGRVSFGKGGTSVSSTIRGQYFYGPSDEVYAFSFLINRGFRGVPWPLICVFLHGIIEDEVSKGMPLTDVELARKMSRRFGKKFRTTFDASHIRGLRPWLPKCSERKSLYGN